MSSFYNQRLPIGKFFEELTKKLFLKLNYKIIDTDSFKKEFDKNTEKFKSDRFKEQNIFLMLRYLPDFIALDENKNSINSFYIDTKVLFTPVYLDTFKNQLKNNLNLKIQTENLGLIEREAYLSYKSHHNSGSKVLIIVICTYNPEIILCSFVEDLEILHKEQKDRNFNSSGSTTPRVNINLQKMTPLNLFLKKLNKDKYNQELIDKFYAVIKEKYNFLGLPKSIDKNIANKIKSNLEEVCNRKLEFKTLG